jgi:hypothetical protein
MLFSGHTRMKAAEASFGWLDIFNVGLSDKSA